VWVSGHYGAQFIQQLVMESELLEFRHAPQIYSVQRFPSWSNKHTVAEAASLCPLSTLSIFGAPGAIGASFIRTLTPE
jgi:hypothetical protein